MDHAPDCSLNDGPAHLPGPCSCGLDVGPIDPIESFIPIVLVGAWRGGLALRERNAETFIKAKQSKIFGGRGIRLRIDLIDPHCWPIFPRGADHLNLNNAAFPVISKGQTKPSFASLQGQVAIAASLQRVLLFWRRSLFCRLETAAEWISRHINAPQKVSPPVDKDRGRKSTQS